MKRFNASKVRALGNLAPLSEKQKAFLKRSKGLKGRWSQDQSEVSARPKEREFLTVKRADYLPPRLRGNSGTRLSAELRAAVEARRQARERFFASL